MKNTQHPVADLPVDALQARIAPAVHERLSHLFRDSLCKGRIHPLYLPVMRYRQAQHAA